jgi:hypothetical protein
VRSRQEAVARHRRVPAITGRATPATSVAAGPVACDLEAGSGRIVRHNPRMAQSGQFSRTTFSHEVPTRGQNTPAIARIIHIVTLRSALAAAAQGVLQAFLCTDLWMTCVKQRLRCAQVGEMLGIPMQEHAHNRVASWKNTIHTLCIEKD